MRCRLLLSSAPPERAESIGRHLVEQGVAACVSLLPGARSIYPWKGKVEQADESLLLIKSAAEVGVIESALRAVHPYELPELIAVDIQSGLAAYLDWVAAHSRGVPPAD
ncbi:divalent-cation tolerance protein CutA [Pseudomarimonas salicorniae]|uniref:Divalent-cation tolerance protein CutA n=1 Tax=Pseudomarimonas salicorniae TaxID=2933270 RepID=A0ABT0GDV7_9GAMM|nr:divalent cation tolerance protein CutA [Lysobacter sp. CAU 1642]MCK7592212.1 divalent-cation tolerance protein CutA [Lysobacter sp. CAU 1642]